MSYGPKARVKRWMISDVLRQRGALTRIDLQDHFDASKSVIAKLLKDMKESREIFISGWRKPDATGMWSPIYLLCVTGREVDAPHPVPERHAPRPRVCEDDEDDALPVRIVRTAGIRLEDAMLARSRAATMGLGMWGALIENRAAAAFSAAT